jgi:putative component of toxin-antitoxin plasmid stabilization module
LTYCELEITVAILEVLKSTTFDVWFTGLRDRHGYRVYFVQRGDFVVVLLCGGDKRTQNADIKHAIQIARIG